MHQPPYSADEHHDIQCTHDLVADTIVPPLLPSAVEVDREECVRYAPDLHGCDVLECDVVVDYSDARDDGAKDNKIEAGIGFGCAGHNPLQSIVDTTGDPSKSSCLNTTTILPNFGAPFITDPSGLLKWTLGWTKIISLAFMQ